MRVLVMGALAVALLAAAGNAAWVYDWVGDPSSTELTVTDPAGDVSGTPMNSRDIVKVWYARDAANHYFRMDLVAAPALNAAAGEYAIQIDDQLGGGNASQSNYIAGGLVNIDQLVMSHFSAGVGQYVAHHRHNFTPPVGVDMADLASLGGGVDDTMNGGATLQWSIPLSQLAPGPFLFYGTTLDINAPATYDITSAILAPAVPEPCTLLLGAVILGCVTGRRRLAA